MKLRILFYPVLLLVVLPIYSQEPNLDIFRSFSLSKNYSLVGSGEDYGYTDDVIQANSADFIVPYTLRGYDVKELRDSVLTLTIGNVYGNVEKSIAKWQNIPGVVDDFKTKEVNPPKEYNMSIWQECVNGDIIGLSDKMLTYRVMYYSYLGGAHGFTALSYINYYIPQQRIISLRDILSPKGIESLPEFLLYKALSKDPDLKDMIHIESVPDGDTFYITDAGAICFVYGEYEIGPYSLGNFEIEVWPYEVINDLTPFGRKLFDIGPQVD